MVYEKYIKKNGKVYGPYLYRSKRVDGKVISEYVGEKKDSNKVQRKFLISATSIAIVLVLFAMIFFSLSSGVFSGKAVSEHEYETPLITGDVVNTEQITIQDIDDGKFQQTARNYKNWIIVTFKLGENEIEYSYSNSLSQEDLDVLIERDKVAWLDKISS